MAEQAQGKGWKVIGWEDENGKAYKLSQPVEVSQLLPGDIVESQFSDDDKLYVVRGHYGNKGSATHVAFSLWNWNGAFEGIVSPRERAEQAQAKVWKVIGWEDENGLAYKLSQPVEASKLLPGDIVESQFADDGKLYVVRGHYGDWSAGWSSPCASSAEGSSLAFSLWNWNGAFEGFAPPYTGR